MRLHRPTKRNQSGFSIIEISLVVLVVAALAVTGLVVYQRHKSTSAMNSAATNQTQTVTQPKSASAKNSAATNQTQKVTQPQSTTSTQTPQASTQPPQYTTHYLTIPELSFRIKLTANTVDAYYSIRNSPVAGQPPNVLLSVHSLDAYPGCGTSQGNDGIAGISTFTEGETDPVYGNFTTAFPDAPQIGGLYYYVEGSQYDCTLGGASALYSDAKHDFIDAYSTIEKIPN